MSTTQGQDELKIPPNFAQTLIEVVDPSQSHDYLKLGDDYFQVQVLTIAAEKKFKRLSSRHADDHVKMVTLTAWEICRIQKPGISMDWPYENASEEDLKNFYIKNLEKTSYNDEVEQVVEQVIKLIKWKPIEPDKKEALLPYVPTMIFSPVFMYNNVREGMTLTDVWHKMTRGALAIAKLGNMVQNDRLRSFDPVKTASDKTSQDMTKAKTADEYLAGLASQGFSMKDML